MQINHTVWTKRLGHGEWHRLQWEGSFPVLFCAVRFLLSLLVKLLRQPKCVTPKKIERKWKSGVNLHRALRQRDVRQCSRVRFPPLWQLYCFEIKFYKIRVNLVDLRDISTQFQDEGFEVHFRDYPTKIEMVFTSHVYLQVAGISRTSRLSRKNTQWTERCFWFWFIN